MKKIIISLNSLIIVFSLILSPSMNAKNNYENDGIFDTDRATEPTLNCCQREECLDDNFDQQLLPYDLPILNVDINIETTTDEFISGLLASDLNLKGTVTTASETIDINDYTGAEAEV